MSKQDQAKELKKLHFCQQHKCFCKPLGGNTCNACDDEDSGDDFVARVFDKNLEVHAQANDALGKDAIRKVVQKLYGIDPYAEHSVQSSTQAMPMQAPAGVSNVVPNPLIPQAPMATQQIVQGNLDVLQNSGLNFSAMNAIPLVSLLQQLMQPSLTQAQTPAVSTPVVPSVPVQMETPRVEAEAPATPPSPQVAACENEAVPRSQQTTDRDNSFVLQPQASAFVPAHERGLTHREFVRKEADRIRNEMPVYLVKQFFDAEDDALVSDFNNVQHAIDIAICALNDHDYETARKELTLAFSACNVKYADMQTRSFAYLEALVQQRKEDYKYTENYPGLEPTTPFETDDQPHQSSSVPAFTSSTAGDGWEIPTPKQRKIAAEIDLPQTPYEKPAYEILKKDQVGLIRFKHDNRFSCGRCKIGKKHHTAMHGFFFEVYLPVCDRLSDDLDNDMDRPKCTKCTGDRARAHTTKGHDLGTWYDYPNNVAVADCPESWRPIIESSRNPYPWSEKGVPFHPYFFMPKELGGIKPPSIKALIKPMNPCLMFDNGLSQDEQVTLALAGKRIPAPLSKSTRSGHVPRGRGGKSPAGSTRGGHSGGHGGKPRKEPVHADPPSAMRSGPDNGFGGTKPGHPELISAKYNEDGLFWFDEGFYTQMEYYLQPPEKKYIAELKLKWRTYNTAVSSYKGKIGREALVDARRKVYIEAFGRLRPYIRRWKPHDQGIPRESIAAVLSSAAKMVTSNTETLKRYGTVDEIVREAKAKAALEAEPGLDNNSQGPTDDPGPDSGIGATEAPPIPDAAPTTGDRQQNTSASSASTPQSSQEGSKEQLEPVDEPVFTRFNHLQSLLLLEPMGSAEADSAWGESFTEDDFIKPPSTVEERRYESTSLRDSVGKYCKETLATVWLSAAKAKVASLYQEQIDSGVPSSTADGIKEFALSNVDELFEPVLNLLQKHRKLAEEYPIEPNVVQAENLPGKINKRFATYLAYVEVGAKAFTEKWRSVMESDPILREAFDWYVGGLVPWKLSNNYHVPRLAWPSFMELNLQDL